MKVVPLSQVAQINPRLPKGLEDSREISFVPMAAVSEDGGIVLQETRNFGEVKKGFTYFQRGDVVLAKITPCFENGKSALADNLEHPIGFGSTEFHVLRAIQGKIEPRFLYHLVRSRRLLSLGQKSMKGAAGHKRVPAEFLENFEIPDWPLDDQIRIAHLLSKVEGLVAQRKQHLQQLDDLLKSVFLEMFGDPVQNEKGWDKPELSVFGKISTGNTPPRNEPANYDGDFIEWIKTDNITGDAVFVTPAIEHLSEVGAKKARTVTSGALLVACIAGSVESIGRAALTDRMVSFNQQINAIQPGKDVNPLYLYGLFKLSRAYIQSHATKGMKKILTKGDFEKITMIKPPVEIQNQFAVVAEKVEGIKSRYQQSLTDLESLYGALSQQAFKGELDLSRVALPALRIEGESPVAATVPVPAPITTPVMELPETDLLLPALHDRAQLAPLLRFWLEAYRTQLGGVAFSLERFIDAAQTRLAELHPDNDFALGASDYEAIKAWVFDEIQNRKLKQTRDIICIDGRRQFGNQILLRARRHAQQ
ncbi:TPA: restriction endonuclease subunit S [Pseudomonas aeruginosa]|uniref:restriction endonuclease subunit S n=1 Tax=Pseudomonas aeruginosa TaxID=287 RepID=UPI0009A1A2A5|nr:restriction endonuclease subunit S [Pseudomonas aeruginosa]MBG4241869.1 restriction endonuclease subunit S [Pseudomonas aeruginosa]MBI8135582.1 restriction endonuclease subunit S [Pseudomonas aeruginosa]MBI8476201.1 restriction endonuclease subunit S [Pseudomonas aeruginosa]MBI8665551.1 restriction endonuclease subunit S [Pseudomonas aeruginosa]MBI8917574.1 restriction endonuclease subunit S [Pseudomonas aeruginosa]